MLKSALASILTSALLLIGAAPSQAIETPSLELGQTLFESSALGSKQRSCSTCHPQGKGLEMVGDFNDSELKNIIAACLRDALNAKPISTESQEMNALLAYVRTFQRQP
jgi:cytochrome c peroxidase